LPSAVPTSLLGYFAILQVLCAINVYRNAYSIWHWRSVCLWYSPVRRYIEFFPYCLFVSNNQVIGCEDRLRNDLYCVGWGVKLYSIQSNPYMYVGTCDRLENESILSYGHC